LRSASIAGCVAFRRALAGRGIRPWLRALWIFLPLWLIGAGINLF